jgi:hypothetical protein
MQWRVTVPVFFGLLSMFGCSLSGQEGIDVLTYTVDFNDGQDGWTGDFTGYPAGEGDSLEYELQFAYTDLPANLGNRKGLMISGHNHNDSLFMFIKNKVTHLYPETEYAIAFEVEFASNAPTGSDGSGEGVVLKAGASAQEPRKIVVGNNCLLNIDKGNKALPGKDMGVLGNIAVGDNTTDYTLITRGSSNYNLAPFTARTNSNGELWLIIGTDSGYEGLTTVYYTRISVVLTVSMR